MNQMVAMMQQMNKMKRDLKKATADLEAKEFTVAKAGIVKVTVTGDKVVRAIDIDKDAFNPDDKEMVQDMVAAAINECIDQIDTTIGDINESITGSREGFNQ